MTVVKSARFHRVFLATIVAFLMFSQNSIAQFYQEWSYDLPQNVRATPQVDKNGNFYFIEWDGVAGHNILHKVNSDGTPGWQKVFTDRRVGNSIVLDQSGNIIVPVDSIPFAPGGGYDHLTSYLKFSPYGTLIANPSILEHLYAYSDDTHSSRSIDFQDNVLFAGSITEWLPCTINGETYTCGYGHLGLTFMNDAGLISKIMVGQGAEWILYGGGTIIGPDLNNEFIVLYGEQHGAYPSITYRHFELRCSASSGVIWKRERNTGDRFVFGLSGSVYRYSSTGFTKNDRLNSLEWTYNYPYDQYNSIIYENPVDFSVLNVFTPANGALPKTLTCLEQDGSVRWSREFDYNIMGFDRDGNLLVRTIDDSLLQISYVDGGVLSSSPNITIIGQAHTDSLGNIFVTRRSKIGKLALLPTLTILDANQDVLSDKEFYLIRVADDAPLFTPDTLGIVTTDADGKIVLNSTQTPDEFEISTTIDTVTVSTGDKIKFAKLIDSEPSVKHANLPLSMYSVHLDNGQFDSSSVLSFTELTGESQDIILDHSEFRYNLVISVEWDAKVEYLNSMERAFRNLSNYLYDVTDGQVRLDTVMIYDDQDHWLDADVRIWANNSLHPNAVMSGIQLASTGDVLNMPRKWFGTLDDSRNGSYDEPQPLDYNDPDNYRQLAHELGHYLLGFEEEYEFTDGNGHCFSVPNYGFMEDPFDNAGIYASEMSNNTMYTFVDCRNTRQYATYGVSCWDMFEIDFEKQYGTDNIFVPVRRPDAIDISEHVTPSGYNYIPGPNDDLGALDYDVGALVLFPQTHTASSAFTIEVSTHDFQANRLGGIDVTLRNPSLGGGWVDIYQGKSSDVLPGGSQGGGIYILGAESGAMIQASSQYMMIGSPSPALAASSSFNWMIGEVIVNGPTDTVSLILTPVEGSFPLVVRPTLSNDRIDLNLDYETLFSSPPSVDLPKNRNYTFTQTDRSYEAKFSDSLGSSGIMTVHALDGNSTPFFFDLKYTYQLIDSNVSKRLFGPSGVWDVWLDTASTATEALMISSPYPVITTGLDVNAIQVGDVHSLALLSDTLSSHLITIRYDYNDLYTGNNQMVNENTLAVYQWDELALSWQLVGGSVDPLLHQIQATIAGSGVFALFSSDIVTDLEDDNASNELPTDFRLSQNYPNPFNPTTTIEYRLSERSHVMIDVFNVLGQKVRSLVNREEVAGSYTITWNGTDEGGQSVSTGVYLYRFQTGDYIETKKMLLLK